MKHTRLASSAAVLAMVMLLALSVVTAPAAAAGVVSGGDWAGDGTDAVADFSADADQNSTVHFETNTTTDTLADIEGLEFDLSYDNTTFLELDEDDVTIVSGDGDDTTTLTVEFTVNHDELDTLPGEINENTTADVYIAELDANGDAITESESEFEVTFQFSDERSVLDTRTAAIDEDDIGSPVETSDRTVGVLSAIGIGDEVTDYSLDEQRQVNGSATDIIVPLQDSDMADAYEVEDADDGDLVFSSMAIVHGELVPVFADEADDDLVDTDEDTFAVLDTSNDMLTINVGDEHEDRTAVDVETASHEIKFHEDFSWTDAFLFSLDLEGFFSSVSPLTIGVGALALPAGETARRRAAGA